MMPGLDGYAVLQALQNDAATAHIPIIFITAKSNMSEVQQATGHSAVGYLAKPFVPGALFAAIKNGLKK
jgi:CheY-like chemotaxis protein